MPKRKKTKPLLYIHQPFSRTPSNLMQNIYRNKLEKHLVQEETESAEVITPVLPLDEKTMPVSAEPHNNVMSDQALTQTGEQEEEKGLSVEMDNPEKEASFVIPDETKHSTFKKVKSFKEMNLQERLEYLVNFPKALPPVPCVFYTRTNNFQGYLLGYENDMITIKFHDQTTRTIPIQELREILMIGIRK